jgi:hypothetical protein
MMMLLFETTRYILMLTSLSTVALLPNSPKQRHAQSHQLHHQAMDALDRGTIAIAT